MDNNIIVGSETQYGTVSKITDTHIWYTNAPQVPILLSSYTAPPVIVIEKKPTWLELKDFVNSLNATQLSQPIIWWGEERGGKVSSISTLEDDYVSNGEGYSPSSTYDEETLKEILEADEPLMVKGTPIIWVD